MRVMETLQQVVPSAKAIGVVVTIAAGAFLAGVGAVLNWGEYTDLPADVSLLQEQRVAADGTIAELAEGLEEAALERARILCLVRLTATGETLSPLEVTERCP
jgi:hypothetical protein